MSVRQATLTLCGAKLWVSLSLGSDVPILLERRMRDGCTQQWPCARLFRGSGWLDFPFLR